MVGKKRVLVLGAAGGIGSEVAGQLADAGWNVVGFVRSMASDVERDARIEWIQGDALVAEAVAMAARGCSVIVHALNPPGYRNWGKLVLPMLDNTIAAAEREDALVVLPGTIYNYGPDAFPVLIEDSPQNPQTRKGAIRVEMESRLRCFADRGGKVLIVRAGDFFGPGAGNNWFSQGLVKPGACVRSIQNPGRAGIGHQWSYLPDVARTMVLLLKRRDALAAFSTFHLAGHWDQDGTQMVQSIRHVVRHHSGVEPKLKAFPWWLVTLLSPFVETLREMKEMRYLWQQPVRMDNAKLQAFLGVEPTTPLAIALEKTLLGLKCL